MAPAPKFSIQEQEDLILDAAANCIWETSLTEFTMASVSKACGLSMGSIYKHVQCKEDIIFALAVKTFRKMREAYSVVLQLDIPTPQRIIGISLLDPIKFQVYPFDSQLEAMVTNEAIIRKASNLWTERMMAANKECEQAFYKITNSAVLNGELKLEGDNLEQQIDEINLGFWAILSGFSHIQKVVQLREIAEGTDTLSKAVTLDSPLIKNHQRLINSYQWQKPLTDDDIRYVGRLLTEMNLR